jgi:UbiA prenyltransferase family
MFNAKFPAPRTLLVLGRVSNLPTVWSNCLAGWLLGGGGASARFTGLALGGSLMYVGGMYLNDAFDADFDRAKRRSRPIPSGAVRETLVWRLGTGMLLAGFLALALLGSAPGVWAALTLISIVVYNAVHKAVTFSPLIMAACRLGLFAAAGAAGKDGLTGLGLWSAVALACWIVGLSYVARREATPSPFNRWPLATLSAPLLLAALADNGEWRLRALAIAAPLAAWAGWSLRHVFAEAHCNPGHTVSGLLAGICLVDWLAAAPTGPLGLAFPALFLLALGCQRHIPAT